MEKIEFDMRELMGDTSITARIHFRRTLWCNVGLAIIRVGAWVTGAQFVAEDVDDEIEFSALVWRHDIWVNKKMERRESVELTTESEEKIALEAGQFYRITAMPIED